MAESTDYYDNIAKGYDELHKEEQLKKIEIIKKYFTPKKDETLLDVGCGTGVSTEGWDCNCMGIDPSKKLISIAKKQAKNQKAIKYLVGKAEELPFEDNSFDHVISITAIQNFDELQKGLMEIKRVGKYKFVLSVLKKSPKIEIIKETIYSLFEVNKEIEEEKDIIFFCKKPFL